MTVTVLRGFVVHDDMYVWFAFDSECVWYLVGDATAETLTSFIIMIIYYKQRLIYADIHN